MADLSSNCNDGETDIYEDLPNFQFDEAFKKLEQDKAYLQNKVEVLAAQLEEMKKENDKLAAKVKALGKNISCLYKTAQREIERKEEIIADLRRERDNLLFRRGLQDYKPSHTKRPSRKQLTPTKKVRNGGLRKVLEGKGKSEAVNDGTITPSSKEYEQICSLASVGSKKSETDVNNEASLDAEVVELSDSDSNVEFLKDVKTSEKVIKTKASTVESIESSSIAVPEEEELRCEEKEVGGQKRKESLDGSPSSKVALELKKTSISDPVSGTEVQAMTNEPRVANCNQTPERVSEDEKSSSFTNNNNKNAEVTSPVKDKISVHMSSEDCGFGRRRVRRVVKPSLSPATAVNTTSADRGVKRPHEETTEASPKILKQPQLLAVEVKQADPRVQKRRCVDGALMTGNQQNQLENSEDDGGAESEKCRMGNQTGSSCKTNSDDLLVLRYDDPEEKEKNRVDAVGEPKSCDNMVQDVKRTDRYKCSSINEKGSHGDERMMRNVSKNYGSSYGVCAFEGKTNHPMQGSELKSPGEPDNEGTVRKAKAIGARGISSKERDSNEKGENGHIIASPQLSPNLSYASDNRSPLRLSPSSRITDDEPSSRRSWDRERVSGPGSRDSRSRPHGEGARCGYDRSGTQVGKGDREGQRGRDHREPSDRGRETFRQGLGREDLPFEKNGDHERGPHRGRDGSRDRSRDYGWDRSREKSEDRDCDRSRDYNLDRSRDRSRERSQDRYRGRSGDRGRDRSRDRSWDRGRRSRDGSWDQRRGKSGDRNRGRSRERSHERDRWNRDHDGERIRDERDRGYDRFRDKERSKYDRRRGFERGRRLNRGRGSCRGRNPNRSVILDRSGDFDRRRETSRGSKDSDRSRDGGRGRDCRNVNSCHSRSSEDSPGRTEGRGSCLSKPNEEPNDGQYDLRKKLNESNVHPDTFKGSERSRDGGRGRDNRNSSGCHSQNVEDSPGEGREKVACQSKPYEKPTDGRYDLRKKLSETDLTPDTSKGVGKRWNGGYKDLDNPSNDGGKENVSGGSKRVKHQESNTIRSPDNQGNSDPREIIPYISEWD